MSDKTAKLFAALSKAQGAMVDATKDANNPAWKSDYATLSSCLDVTRPVLAKHGLTLSQWLIDGALLTVLGHDSGEWMRSVYPVKPEKMTPQGFGSAFTYARRYTVMAVAGISHKADDDDAEAATNRGSAKAAKEPAPKPAATAPPTEAEVAAGALKANKVEVLKQFKALRPPVPEGETYHSDAILIVRITQSVLGKAKAITLGDCELVRLAVMANPPMYNLNTGELLEAESAKL